MSLKIITIFVVFVTSYLTIQGAIFRDSAIIGDVYQFEFGDNIKSLVVVRDENVEELKVGEEGIYPNVKFTNEGMLIISPVTENDFGIYHGITENEDTDKNVAPLTLDLLPKE
uniref:T9SS C-terminal target domain-containing protein n=1 Tax=Strongyloides venezuelensis TaxID=75913 RepID=A0A0K0EUR1_STRVS